MVRGDITPFPFCQHLDNVLGGICLGGWWVDECCPRGREERTVARRHNSRMLGSPSTLYHRCAPPFQQCTAVRRLITHSGEKSNKSSAPLPLPCTTVCSWWLFMIVEYLLTFSQSAVWPIWPPSQMWKPFNDDYEDFFNGSPGWRLSQEGLQIEVRPLDI